MKNVLYAPKAALRESPLYSIIFLPVTEIEDFKRVPERLNRALLRFAAMQKSEANARFALVRYNNLTALMKRSRAMDNHGGKPPYPLTYF